MKYTRKYFNHFRNETSGIIHGMTFYINVEIKVNDNDYNEFYNWILDQLKLQNRFYPSVYFLALSHLNCV
jgi:6-pyruvoyl-tetrahydropterin synthase